MTPNPDPFTTAVEGTTLYLTPLGDITSTQVAAQRIFLKEHLGRAKRAVVLNLQTSEFVDSLGITLIVGLYKSCQERKLGFSITGASTEVLRLFTFFNLNDVFEIRER